MKSKTVKRALDVEKRLLGTINLMIEIKDMANEIGATGLVDSADKVIHNAHMALSDGKDWFEKAAQLNKKRPSKKNKISRARTS